jgi:hypothetical protein
MASPQLVENSDQSSISASKNSLLGLPLEIRLEIYKYFHNGRLTYRCPHQHNRFHRAKAKIPANLLLICRQMHNEATSVGYRSVYFCVLSKALDYRPAYSNFIYEATFDLELVLPRPTPAHLPTFWKWIPCLSRLQQCTLRGNARGEVVPNGRDIRIGATAMISCLKSFRDLLLWIDENPSFELICRMSVVESIGPYEGVLGEETVVAGIQGGIEVSCGL